MKKLNLILGIFLISIYLCGCDKNNNQNKIDENQQNLQKTLIKELNCNALGNAKYNMGNYFITNDNDLYILNTNQLYSNDENCKKLNDDNTKILKIMSGSELFYVIDANNNIFQLEDDTGKILPYEEHNNHTNTIRNEVKSLNDNNVVIQKGEYILKNDGKLYKYRYRYENQEIEEFIIYKEFENEKILDFGYYDNVTIKYETYSLNIISQFIKTDKAFYTTTITNKECLKYADVECKYDFIKNEKLTTLYDDIHIYTGNLTYITKEGKQYKLYE